MKKPKKIKTEKQGIDAVAMLGVWLDACIRETANAMSDDADERLSLMAAIYDGVVEACTSKAEIARAFLKGEEQVSGKSVVTPARIAAVKA